MVLEQLRDKTRESKTKNNRKQEQKQDTPIIYKKTKKSKNKPTSAHAAFTLLSMILLHSKRSPSPTTTPRVQQPDSIQFGASVLAVGRPSTT